jgi:AcrR family transcriptional regulator
MKKDTKSRIRETALGLFNEKGISETTLRQIAQAMGISQGNLTYHYQLKEQLIEALYFELVEKLDAQLSRPLPTEAEEQGILGVFFNTSYRSLTQMYAYRFFLRDFYKVMTESPGIRAHYLALQERRTEEFLFFFQSLQQQGLMRPPAFAGEYERLYERMNILGDNWINAMELLRGQLPDPVTHYASLLFESLFPYLTQKGQQAFFSLKKNK